MPTFLRNLLVLGSAVGFTYLGVRAFNTYKAIQGLKYRILGIKIKEGTSLMDVLSGNFILVLQIAIINESTSEIPFQGMNLNIYLNENYFANTVIPKGKMIPAKSVVKLDVDILTSSDQLSTILINNVREVISGKNVTARLQGYIIGLDQKIPVNESFIVNEIKPLQETNQNILSNV